MIRCEQVHRRFPGPHGVVRGLDGLDLRVERGDFVAIQGPSGSGKTTLLLALGGMLRPSSGRILIHDQDLYALPPPKRDALRARTVGFVFQMFHLLPYLTARENVLAGLARGSAAVSATAADELLERLGLAHRRDHPAHRLSAGERQRVALARAFVKQPELILADEPTGNLDPETAASVCTQLAEFNRAGGTVIVVTHGPEIARQARRSLHLSAGRLTP